MPLRSEAQVGPSVVPNLWCTIYQIAWKNATYNCHLLQKYTQTSQQSFCNFFRSTGHDEHTCRSDELMMDRMPTYSVQAETRPLEQNAGMAWIRFQGCRWGQGKGGPGGGREQLICYNCGALGHYSHDCMNPMNSSCKYYMFFGHETKDFPMLIARIRKKGVLPPPLTQNL